MLSQPFILRAALLLAFLSLSACQSTYRPQGQDGAVGTYKFGRASIRLSQPVRIQTVIAAANAALRARGYTIESTQSSSDSGRLVGRQADSQTFEKLVVTAEFVPGAVEISIAQQPWGDEERSRAVMDAILQRLGL